MVGGSIACAWQKISCLTFPPANVPGTATNESGPSANAVGRTTVSDALYMVHGNHFPRLPGPDFVSVR